MPRRAMLWASWLMAIVLPLNAVALDSVGILTSFGTVLVDNQPASTSGAIFAGAVVETKAHSKAVVVYPGKNISLGENSRMRMDANLLELQSGAVLVSLGSGSLRLDKVSISGAAGAPAKFLARKVNGELQVLTLEGTVSISDGQQTTQVPATKGVKLPSVGKASWLLNDDIGILIVVAAAIAAGVTVGIVNAQNPISPAHP